MTIAFALALLLPQEYPDLKAAGVRDVMLVFDWSNATAENVLPCVAYLDAQGKPKDWFYDGFLFLRSGAWVNGVTTKAQWEALLDRIFTYDIEQLASAVDTASKTLGPPKKPIQIVVLLPYPSVKQTAFGDGDFSKEADRRKALDWYVRAVAARFEAQRYRHFALWGFYWNGEGVYEPSDEFSIKAASESAHAIGKKLLWIPYNYAPGIDRWKALGLDVVTMQPNYAFAGVLGGNAPGDEDRLTRTAKTCREKGMGLEMEFYGAQTSPAHFGMARFYLDHGDPALDGYRDTVHTYYHAGFVAEARKNPRPAVRRLYEDLYAFAKGTHKARGYRQPLPASQDGMTFDLGEGRLVGDVRVPSQRIVVELSEDGENFVQAGVGCGIATFPVRWARRMRVKTEGEVTLFPAANLLQCLPYTGGKGDGINLTDGCVNLAEETTWAASRGKVTFQLDEPMLAGTLWVHFRHARKPKVAVGKVEGEGLVVGDGAWASVPINRIVKDLEVTVSDAEAVAIDEIALLPGNPAVGKAYTIDPPFAATHPDTGGTELTDEAASSGIADGRAVGWYAMSPGWPTWMDAGIVTVTVDTGEARAIDSVEAHVLGGGAGGVEFPQWVLASVSEDGLEWSAETALDAPAANRMKASLGGAKGRYARLRFWRKAAWIMVSEVRVLSGGANVAVGRPYTLLPQPTAAWVYLADNSGKLTDGYYTTSSAVSGWDPCSSFIRFTADATVALDLGGALRLQGARMHFADAALPRRMDVSTSMDGKTWMPAGTGTDVTFAAREARYVRYALSVDAGSKVMPDEIEVVPLPH